MTSLSKYILIIVLSNLTLSLKAQSLLDMLEEENKIEQDTIIVTGTFKSTRLINGQTSEICGKNQLNFIISHRFGDITMGGYELWGLDHSLIRLGLEYGLMNKLDIGIGRSNENTLIDGYIKYKILSQSSGARNIPVTLTWYSSIAYTDQMWSDPVRKNLFTSRLFYVHHAIISRKFSDRISLQVTPGVVHRNLVENNDDQNDVPYIGFGGRIKLTSRISLNGEYFWILPGKTAENTVNSLAFGFDIETGGHVFQLHFSNSRGRTEQGIPNNVNDWLDGEFGFGFNIIRNFNLKK